MKTQIIICLLSITICSCCAEPQKEQAKLPYATVFNAVTMDFKEIESMTNREARFVISSHLPNVKTKDIKLYINSQKGKIPLQLNADGSFSLPIRDDLMKENPFIVFNQPKGTLSLEGTISLKGELDPEKQVLSEQHKARYAYLFSIEGIMDQVHSHVAESLKQYESKREETISWVEFKPTSLNNAPALIHSAGGDIKVNPDQDGVIRIKYDAKLAKENPWVTFPSEGKCRIQTKLKVKAEPQTDPYSK